MNLKDDIKKIPNILSLSRIVLSPVVFLLLGIPGLEGKIISIVFLALLFLTDFFDGMLARMLNQTSDLGRILDPLADKALVAVLFIALVFFRGLPAELIIMVAVRDVLILLGGLYIRYSQNKIVESNIWGKLSTAVLMIAVLFLILEDFWYITAGLFAIGLLCMIISSFTYLAVFYGFLTKQGKKYMRWILFACILISLAVVAGFQFVPAEFDPAAFHREEYTEIDSPEALNLARQYAPIVWLAEKEQYYPVDAKIYLDHSKIMAQKKYLGLVETVVAVEPVTSEKMQSFNGSEFFIKIDHTELDISKLDWTTYAVTVYSRVIKITSGYVIQYWFFYLGSEAGDTGIYVHDADWEMIQIVLNNSEEPVAAGYSAHYYGNVRKWENVETIHGHPVVYIGLGSHGCYFEQGIHKAYLDNQKLLHIGTDTAGKGEKLELDTGYTIELLTENQWWVTYKGFWAAPFGSKIEGPFYRNPNNPEISMWQAPMGWMRYYSLRNN